MERVSSQAFPLLCFTIEGLHENGNIGNLDILGADQFVESCKQIFMQVKPETDDMNYGYATELTRKLANNDSPSSLDQCNLSTFRDYVFECEKVCRTQQVDGAVAVADMLRDVQFLGFAG